MPDKELGPLPLLNKVDEVKDRLQKALTDIVTNYDIKNDTNDARLDVHQQVKRVFAENDLADLQFDVAFSNEQGGTMQLQPKRLIDAFVIKHLWLRKVCLRHLPKPVDNDN